LTDTRRLLFEGIVLTDSIVFYTGEDVPLDITTVNTLLLLIIVLLRRATGEDS
jgi:hypothetical protein